MRFVSIAKHVTVRTAVIAALISSALSAGAADVAQKYRLPGHAWRPLKCALIALS